jgi:hypothetical protein
MMRMIHQQKVTPADRIWLTQITHYKALIQYPDRFCGLEARDSGFDSRLFQILWEVVGLEWGPLCLVRVAEELLKWKSSGCRSKKSRLTQKKICNWCSIFLECICQIIFLLEILRLPIS